MNSSKTEDFSPQKLKRLLGSKCDWQMQSFKKQTFHFLINVAI